MAHKQRIDVIAREHARLGRASQRLAFQTALARAYSAFARHYPQWAEGLFDEHFLTHRAAPLLARCVARDGSLAPGELAEAWADQVALLEGPRRRWLVAALTPAAADFLQWLEAELRFCPEFRTLFDSRALDTIAHAAIQTAQTLEALQMELETAQAEASAAPIIVRMHAMTEAA